MSLCLQKGSSIKNALNFHLNFCRSKLWFIMLKLITIYTCSIAFIAHLAMYWTVFDRFHFFIYGVFWSFVVLINVNSYQNSLTFYLFYFKVVCYYFKLKLRRKNMILKSAVNKLNRQFKIMKMIGDLNKIYNEIDQFNNEFWARFLSINLTFYLIYISDLFYSSFLGQLDMFSAVTLGFFFSFNLLILLLFISSTASMSSEAEKANSLIYKIYLFENHSLRRKIKVN